MYCKKCKKEIPEGAVFCCWCGKKQTNEQKKTHRRAKGTGTIRKDTRYASQWIAIAPPKKRGINGQYLGSFRTQKEAQAALEQYQNEKYPDLYNVTLDKIYDLWSAKHFEELSKSGEQGYKAAYKSIADLSRRRFRELKTVDFQRCVDEQAQTGASRSKLEKIKQLCSQLCKYAMQNDVIDKNYAEFIRLPKAEKKEKQIFTKSDRETLWAHAEDRRVQIILVMIYMGFRIGEIAAVKPADIYDTYIIGGEKTEAGKNRVVPFPQEVPEIEQFVRSWIVDCKTDTIIGQSADYIRKYMFYPCLAELGLIAPPIKSEKTGKDLYIKPRLTPHSCRHTFASLSVEAGMPPEVLQKIIGHANYETTADIYVHKDIDALLEGMCRIKK